VKRIFSSRVPTTASSSATTASSARPGPQRSPDLEPRQATDGERHPQAPVVRRPQRPCAGKEGRLGAGVAQDEQSDDRSFEFAQEAEAAVRLSLRAILCGIDLVVTIL
jgi:hypothetical protein